MEAGSHIVQEKYGWISLRDKERNLLSGEDEEETGRELGYKGKDVFWGPVVVEKNVSARQSHSSPLDSSVRSGTSNLRPQGREPITPLVSTRPQLEYIHMVLLSRGEYFCPMQINGTHRGCSSSFSQWPLLQSIVPGAQGQRSPSIPTRIKSKLKSLDCGFGEGCALTGFPLDQWFL